MGNRSYPIEVKLECIRMSKEEHLSTYEIARRMDIQAEINVRHWLELYDEHGEEWFYRKRGPRAKTPYSELSRKRNRTREEELELENIRLRIENERLKKGYIVKGVGANKEFVTLKEKNTK